MSRGRPFDDWLVTLSAFPPAVWMKVRTYRTVGSARAMASMLKRRLPHVRFEAIDLDLFARARRAR